MKIGKLMNLAEQTTNRKSKGKLTHLKNISRWQNISTKKQHCSAKKKMEGKTRGHSSRDQRS
jgi:hypothetical protein